MMRYFNTEGRCRPDIHYMVRLEERLDKIKRLYVDRGKYFVINKGRQYGKTTTLMALATYLKEDYAVLPMDFQSLGTDNFADGPAFVVSFIEYVEEIFSRTAGVKNAVCPEAYQNLIMLKNQERKGLDKLFRALSELCRKAEKPLVLIIDEADSAANNQIFTEFLAQLRRYYLDRENSPTFHSVILAGVYDIKNLKQKIRPKEAHQYNSPWNIAARFNIEMDFSAGQIADMLWEYEKDRNTGMDVDKVAGYIYDYTSGYPYLVSAIAKFLDEEIPGRDGFENSVAVWSRSGVEEAVKMLLKERLPLFDSLVKQLDLYPDLKNIMRQVLYEGKKIPFNPDTPSINMGIMFGFLKEKNDQVIIANRIFEMRLLNMLISEEALGSDAFQHGERDKNQFIRNGRLDMERVLEKFVKYFQEIYGENDEKFVEKYGRKFFLLYLKPIINGTGNYYLEAQTRDAGRTDVIVDYRGEQFVIEMKIWHGHEYNERGKRQLTEYLDYFGLDKGYMLSFNFNRKKETGVRQIQADGRVIVEAVV